MSSVYVNGGFFCTFSGVELASDESCTELRRSWEFFWLAEEDGELEAEVEEFLPVVLLLLLLAVVGVL